MSTDQTALLSIVVKSNIETDKCTICTGSDSLIRYNNKFGCVCKCYFHKECWLEFIKNSNNIKCPYCRNQLSGSISPFKLKLIHLLFIIFELILFAYSLATNIGTENFPPGFWTYLSMFAFLGMFSTIADTIRGTLYWYAVISYLAGILACIYIIYTYFNMTFVYRIILACIYTMYMGILYLYSWKTSIPVQNLI